MGCWQFNAKFCLLGRCKEIFAHSREATNRLTRGGHPVLPSEPVNLLGDLPKWALQPEVPLLNVGAPLLKSPQVNLSLYIWHHPRSCASGGSGDWNLSLSL